MRRRSGCKYESGADHVAVTRLGVVYFLTPEIFEMLSKCNGLTALPAIQGLADFIEKDRDALEIISLDRDRSEGDETRGQIITVDGLVAPCRQAIWHLTQSCNMRCGHCYRFPGDIKEPFSEGQIEATADNLSALGVECVRLSGGEVTLDHRKLECAVAALTQGNRIPVVLNTNGWKHQDRTIELLRDNPFARGVQISLDGTKESHNALRGVDSYDEIVSNIGKYLEAGIHVRVISMLTDDWLDRNEIRRVCGAIADLGISDWTVEIPSVTGRWTNDLTIRVEEVVSAALEFHAFFESHDHGVGRFSFAQVFDWPLPPTEEAKRLEDPVCSHDLGLITFGPEGVAYCSLFQDRFGEELACLGHMHDSNYKEIWNRIATVRLTHTIADNQSCRWCPLFWVCQGGCPGQYGNPVQFQGCDTHSRNLALSKMRVYESLGIPLLKQKEAGDDQSETGNE